MLNSLKIPDLFSPACKAGIKPVILFFLVIIINTGVSAQENLVPNGSFEEYDYCPGGTNDFAAVSLWINPTTATPDYYNVCANNGGGVPSNDWGFQYPQDGDGYAGLVLYGKSLNAFNAREYIQIQLLQPLEPNQTYCFRAYISRLDSADFASNNLGIALTVFPITSTSEEKLNVAASDTYDSIITDNINWSNVQLFFKASGGESYLTIGNFFDNTSTDTIQIGVNQNGGHVSYYYIDNVSLEKFVSTVEFPNCFTPNNDSQNDKFYPVITGDLAIGWSVINRWGETIFKSSEKIAYWDGKFNGEDCPQGVYFYKFETDKEIKAGFFQLVR